MGTLDRMAGVPQRPSALDGLLEAVVHRVDADGLHVRLTGGQQRFVHGPCRWAAPEAAGDPPAGTGCLVARSDAGRWWVVAFDGWPA